MELRRQCVVCGEYDYPEEVQIYKVLTDLCVEKAYICSECQKDFIKMKCEKCGYEYFYSEKDYRADEKIREIVRAGLCNICYEEKLRELKMEIFDNEKQPSLPFETIDEVLMWLK
jgi:predicted nucleic-acid-binding Zn-ribbon protein